MSEATAVCVPCERPHEHLRPLAEVMKNMYVAHPEAAESVMEYFSALHDRDFERAEIALRRMNEIGYHEWRRLRPWGPLEGTNETEEDARRRWNDLVEAIGRAIVPDNPGKGIEILERVAWIHAPHVYPKVKDHYVNRKVPRSMLAIRNVFREVHDILVDRLREVDSEQLYAKKR